MTTPNITLTVDGRKIEAQPGQTILEATDAAGLYVPRLCWLKGLLPFGSCRVCTVRVAGRYMAACTQPVTEGMAVENEVPDLEDMRKALVAKFEAWNAQLVAPKWQGPRPGKKKAAAMLHSIGRLRVHTQTSNGRA